MYKLCSRHAAAAGRLAIIFTAVASAALMVGMSATPVRADDIPFWERSDRAKAAADKVRKAEISTSRKKARVYASRKKPKVVASRKKLGGYAAKTEQGPTKRNGVRVAALGTSYVPSEPRKSITGGTGIRWVASAGCLAGSLKGVLGQLASSYGRVTVSSTCRSVGRNRAVGGARKSKHLTGNAADFRVHGASISAVYAYLRSNGSVGGLKHYGGGLFHIDTGPRRSW
jgi:hypothetical protein